MTNREIKNTISKYFKDFLFSEFEVNRNILYAKPLNNFLIGFCFEKSHSKKDSLYVWAFVQPLYVPSEDVFLTFGYRISDKLWHIKNNENIAEEMKILSDFMKKSYKEFLSNVNSSSKFYDYYHNKCENIRMIEGVVYSAIHCKSEDAKLILENYINILKEQNLNIIWIEQILKKMIYLRDIIDDDKKIEDLINNNVNFTKSNLKL